MGTNSTDPANSILSPLEIDAIGEVMNISMGSAATAVSQMLDRQVEITTPSVEVEKFGQISYGQLEPALAVKITYTTGLQGSNVMVFRQHDMQMILNTLMGIPDEPADDFVFDDLSISAASEVMNQMMGSSSTALAEFLSRKIDISTPTAAVMENDGVFREMMGVDPEEDVVAVTFRLTISDMVDSEFISVMTIDFVKEIISTLINKNGDVQLAPEATPEPQPPAAAEPAPPQPAPAAAAQPAAPPPAAAPQAPAAAPVQPAPPPVAAPAQPPVYAAPAPGAYPQVAYAVPEVPIGPPVSVRPVEFPEFSQYPVAEGVPVMGGNLDLIMNVPLEVSIEIGTTKRKIRDIMNFTSGTVVELDKQAGAPVDVVVNGQLIAHGDVVVIDDNFGVRITEIVGTKELINSLGASPAAETG